MFIFLLIIYVNCSLHAQNSILSSNYKNNTIETLSQILKDNYVFTDLGEEAAIYLKELNTKGHFKPYQNFESFASELTKRIFAITNDKHISISLREIIDKKEGKDELSRWVESRMDERKYFRLNNANFKSIKKLHGNIGYLELRGFYGLDFGKEFADYAMAMLATSDAIIIDLRNNFGGRGDMVDYLLSYFFDQPIITSKTKKRNGNEFVEKIHYTQKLFSGKKVSDIPLYVLISSNTFSAAEGFSYPLKVYKRAIFIGETTKGGANPGDIIPINKELNVFIPDVSVTHPLTNASWEGVGIQPDIKVRSGDALEIAITYAYGAAEKYRIANDEKAKLLLIELNETISSFHKDSKNEKIINCYIACRQQDLIFEEWELNSLGYNYLGEKNNTITAEAIFEANTVLYPHSANTFDSYAEALLKNGKIEKAILNYEKAVLLAMKYNNDNLKLISENLERAKDK